MLNASHRLDLEQERDRLKIDLANEFKFFAATEEFRPGMLPSIIRQMTRYETIDMALRADEDDGIVEATEVEAVAIDDPKFDFDPSSG